MKKFKSNVDKILDSKVTRKQFLAALGLGTLSIPLLSPSVAAQFFIRQTNGNLINIDDLGSASPEGADGNIQYRDGSNFAASENLHWDSSTNRLGIGTDEPDHPLHVIGNGYFTGAVRVATPVSGNDATTKNYVDTTTVGLIGDQTIGGTKTFTSSVEIDTSGAAELILRGNERGSIGQGAFTDGLGNTANNDDTWIRTRFGGSAGNFNLNTVFRDAGGITMYGPNSSGVIWNINTSGQLTTGNVPWARLSGHPTITAGDGLSGGGSLNTNRTISVDSTVVRTSGNQTIGGNKRFNELTGFGVAPSTIWRIYSRSSSNSVYIRTDSSSSGVYALRVRSGANSTALTVMGNARVGIGTSSPNSSLHVIGSGYFTGAVRVGKPVDNNDATTKKYVDEKIAQALL